MTVREYDPPRFRPNDPYTSESENKESPWCVAIRDCCNYYEGTLSNYQPRYQFYSWPLTRYEFEHFPDSFKYLRGTHKTYSEYLEAQKTPYVTLESYPDSGFYGLKNLDHTLTFAYQNKEYVFIVHIEDFYANKLYPEGFGCVISKLSSEIHFVALGEDDGFYWGDHIIEMGTLGRYDLGVVLSIVNNMSESLFWDKDRIIEDLYRGAKENKICLYC